MTQEDYELSKEVHFWAGRLIGNEQAYEIAHEIVEAINYSEGEIRRDAYLRGHIDGCNHIDIELGLNRYLNQKK